jgi:flagellar hook assembly protein FlgD
MGHKIRTLIDMDLAAGYKSVQWNATNDAGASVSAGLYFYTIQAGKFSKTNKMLLLK